jgi:hypothetical protein
MKGKSKGLKPVSESGVVEADREEAVNMALEPLAERRPWRMPNA